MEIAIFFYKNIFGFEVKDDIHLGHDFWSDSDLVIDKENDKLQQPLSEEEIKNVVMSSYAHGAPGPYGLSFLFYQTLCDLIKHDFMALVREFENGSLDLYRLNFSINTLIPKESNLKEMKKFRLISMSKWSVKIFIKAMTNSVSTVCDRLISPNQTTFIRWRFILESVVMAIEVIHEIHSLKSSALVLKLDYEKSL